MKETKFWNKRGKGEGPWDTIVIGSGMGGMTSAAMLAKLGHRVLVLEQHYTPGGFTHEFRRKHYSWDVGVHAIGEVTEHTMTGRLLKKLTDGGLEWASLGSVYEDFHFPDGFRLQYPDKPAQFRDNLLAAFPEEKTAIDRYLQLVKEASSGMRGFYFARALPQWMTGPADLLMARKARKFLAMNTMDVMRDLTSNERLQAAFCAQWGYYGAPPSRSSFAMQAMVTRHFLHGAYYPVGGSGEIARNLLRTVADAGGWTRISTDVNEIMVEKNRAIGVRLADGEEIQANNVVSAAGVMSTIKRLLPESHGGESWAGEVMKVKPAPAHVCLYIGFKGDIRKLGMGSANKWFYSSWDLEHDSWDVTAPGSDAPVLYCSFPSLKDPNHDPGPEMRHTGEVVTFVPYEVFEKWEDTRWRKRGEDYEALKKRLQDEILAQYLKHLPELEPYLDHVELSTPTSTQTFCRPMAGSIYGLEPTPERFTLKGLRPRSPIKNLYFSGCEVVSPGVIGAMMGGVLGALAVEPWSGFNYMRGVL